jgi:hypothetical protein
VQAVLSVADIADVLPQLARGESVVMEARTT